LKLNFRDNFCVHKNGVLPPLHSTLPALQPKRALIFSIRLTETEQDKIDQLAKRLNLPSSFMTRHFIMEAVNHHKNQMMAEVALDA
jgi:predicted DNA-binding protein